MIVTRRMMMRIWLISVPGHLVIVRRKVSGQLERHRLNPTRPLDSMSRSAKSHRQD